MKFDEVGYVLDLSEPDEELLEWAKNNINEDPDMKYQLIEELRDMIYGNGECDPPRIDDAFLIRFLRARHFNVKYAYKLFVRYCQFREDNRKFHEGVDLQALSKIGDENIIVVPPYWDSTGRRFMIYRAKNWNPDKYSVDNLFQASLAILELCLVEERNQIMGGIGIFDFEGLTMQQAMHCTPNVAKKVFQLMVTCFPLRLHAIHIINQSYSFEVMYKLFKPFLNKHMKERIFFHGTNYYETLHKHINPKCLPERYGGIHPDYGYKDWIHYIRGNEKVMNELKSLGYQEYPQEEEVDQNNKKS